MDENRIKAVFIWPAFFKIKSKADAEKMLNMATNTELYWHDDQYDYYLMRFPDGPEVARRPLFERGNIFSPYLVLTDPVQAIWDTRKYINHQIFSDE